MRNPNGFGSVYKLKGNRRKPWIARVTTKLEDGKQFYHVIGYYAKRQDGMAALLKYHGRGIGERIDIKLKDLYEEWKKKKYSKISKATQNNYNAAWIYLSDLGDKKVVDIKKSQLQELIDKLDMSFSTKHKIKTLATMLWDYGMADDIVDKNYAKLVELKREVKKDKLIFNDIEIDKINKLAKEGDEQAMIIMILIYTGMRINELLGITRFNVDLKNDTITGGLKTEAGIGRIIPLNAKISPYVQHWWDKGTDLLITREGKKLSANYFRNYYWHQTLIKAGITDTEERGITPHSTRHTCATMLSRAGVDTLSIQRILGHANYSITADLYTRTDNDKLKDAISKI